VPSVRYAFLACHAVLHFVGDGAAAEEMRVAAEEIVGGDDRG